MKYSRFPALIVMSFVLAACGGGGSGATPSAMTTANGLQQTASVESTPITVSGGISGNAATGNQAENVATNAPISSGTITTPVQQPVTQPAPADPVVVTNPSTSTSPTGPVDC